MSGRITIADVAREAGVSLMTVSRAVNNKEGIGKATRQRILALAEEMGYRPNSLARGLATSHTTTIGLIVPDITNPFFADIARGVEDVAYAQDYSVFLLNSSEQTEREAKALTSLWANQVDGVILCSPRLSTSELETHLVRFKHVVLVNRKLSISHAGLAVIDVDDAEGAAQVVAQFVAQGRHKAAFIAGPTDSFSGQKRLNGFKAACAAHGMMLADGMVQHCAPDSQGGYVATRSLLEAHPATDAIFAYNDLVAVGVLQACRERGLSVPKDVAVVGVDDIPLANLVTPRLTTLRIDKQALGGQAMQTILDLIDADPSVQHEQVVHPQLVFRESMQT